MHRIFGRRSAFSVFGRKTFITETIRPKCCDDANRNRDLHVLVWSNMSAVRTYFSVSEPARRRKPCLSTYKQRAPPWRRFRLRAGQERCAHCLWRLALRRQAKVNKAERVSTDSARTAPNGRGVYTWRALRCTIPWNDRGRLK